MAGEDRPIHVEAADITPRSGVIQNDAIGQLAAAIRSGEVSANDFVDRYGQLAQMKKTAAIQGLHEFISPEAIQSRREKLALERKQTSAEAEVVEPQGQLLKTKLALEQAAADSPGVEEYLKYAGLFGVTSHPKNPDGSLDLPKIAKMGARMAQVMASRSNAQSLLGSITLKEGSQPGEYQRLTKAGVPVTGSAVSGLQDQAYAALPDVEAEFGAPGNVVTGNGVTPATQNGQYYGIGNEGLISPKTAPAAPQPKPTIEPTAPGGLQASPDSAVITMGPKPLTPEQKSKMEDQAAQFGELDMLINNADRIVKQGNVTGPAKGNALVANASNLFTKLTGLDQANYQDRQEITKLINSKVLEKSTLLRPVSDKDLAFLQAAAPQLNDTPETWNKYLTEWRAYIDRHKVLLAAEMKKPVDEIFPPSVVKPSAAGSPSAGVTKNVNGQIWRRNSNGGYEYLGPAQ